MERFKYSFLGFVILLCISTISHAQCNFSGSVANSKKEGLQGATVMLFESDSLIGGAVTNKHGLFELVNLPEKDYVCVVSMLGFKTLEQTIHLPQTQKIYPFILQEEAEELDELTVNADKRNLIKIGAGYSSYKLSDKALNANNVYESLREIPNLIVDESNRRIMLSSGEDPKILINGVYRPGYINSLDPAMIESVEVIENPSAKYRGDQSVRALLNIKTKRGKEKPYINGNLYSRHHVGAVYGVSGASFETGNNKASFYVDAMQFYFHHDDAEISEYTQSGDLVRDLSGDRRYNSNMISVNVGADWLPSENNYWAFGMSFVTNPQDYTRNSIGTVSDIQTQDNYSTNVYHATDNSYYTNTYSLYYKHNFQHDNYLEATGSFGLFGSGAKGNRMENSSLYAYNSLIDLDNKKKSLNLELNYRHDLTDNITVDFGANTYMQHTTIEDLGNRMPKFHYKNLTEYIYGDIQHNLTDRFSYRASLALDLVFTNADGTTNRYVNFVPSASLAYTLNNQSYLLLNFARERTSPGAGLLNPRNTSVDSLRLLMGNSYLEPVVSNSLYLSYAWNHNGVYLAPFIQYNYSSDIIMPVGYMNKNVYIQTYENTDRMQWLRSGLNSRFNLSNFGNLNLSVFYQKDFVPDMPFDGHNWGTNVSLNLYYKNVSMYAFVSYKGYTYTRTSKRFMTPESELIFTWDLPKNWALMAGLRYFAAGDNHSSTWVKDQNFSSFSKDKLTDRFLMPTIGLSYSFKNKIQKKNRQQHRVRNTDSGVSGITVD